MKRSDRSSSFNKEFSTSNNAKSINSIVRNTGFTQNHKSTKCLEGHFADTYEKSGEITFN